MPTTPANKAKVLAAVAAAVRDGATTAFHESGNLEILLSEIKDSDAQVLTPAMRVCFVKLRQAHADTQAAVRQLQKLVKIGLEKRGDDVSQLV